MHLGEEWRALNSAFPPVDPFRACGQLNCLNLQIKLPAFLWEWQDWAHPGARLARLLVYLRRNPSSGAHQQLADGGERIGRAWAAFGRSFRRRGVSAQQQHLIWTHGRVTPALCLVPEGPRLGKRLGENGINSGSSRSAGLHAW
jgi:hypothetical protein